MPKITYPIGFWEYQERIDQIGGIRRYNALVKRLLSSLKKQAAMPLTNFSKGYACTKNFYAPQSLVDQLDLYVRWRNSDRSQIIRQGLNAGLLNAETMFQPSQHWGEKLTSVGVRLTNRDLKAINQWLKQPANVGFSLSDALRKIASNFPLPARDPIGSKKHMVKPLFYDDALHLNLARTAQVMEVDLANVIKGYMCLSLHPERQNRITRYLGRFLSKPLMQICPPPSFMNTELETGLEEEEYVGRHCPRFRS
jgi:hypothetical protein